VSSRFTRWLPLTLIALGALWLRVHELALRPMHADEANQAVKTGELLENGHYVFDPGDHHGPTLYYAALPIAWIRGQRTLAALDETTVRLVPALFGTIAVLLIGVLAAPLGRITALTAAGFLAVSPPAVYYSRYFIQETLLLTFMLGGLVCGARWWRSGRSGWCAAAGGCIGLMLATKETALLFLGAAAVALLSARPPRPATLRWRRDLAIALGTAFVVSALFYTSFGSHLAGLRDFGASLFGGWKRATGATSHEKPWWYYLRLFAWQREGGLIWEQVLFSLLAFAGAILALSLSIRRRAEAAERSRAENLLYAAAIYTAIVALILSAAPYKTPWNMIHLVPGMAVLAAGAMDAIARLRTGKIVAVAAVFLTAATLLSQTWQAAFTRAADPRNPYAYVHSAPDVLKFRALVEAALVRAPATQPIRIISEEYWPLPWYLRGLPRVGYWSNAPADCDGALVIVAASQAENVRAKLRGHYRESFLGLRPDFLCVVFTPTP
jgi:uncharacterized protein (TIGR03663 family)